MRLLPAAVISAISLSLAVACYADIITLKNGRIINGTYVGGTARQIKVEVGDNIQTLDVADIARIEFSNGGYASSRSDTPRDDGRPTLRRADADSGSSSSSSSSSSNGGYGSGSTGSRPVILQPDPNDTGSYPSSGSSGSSYPTTDGSRPTLRRADSSSSSSSSDSSSNDSNRPTLIRAPDSGSTASSSTPDDPDRPVLRRATPDPAAAGTATASPTLAPPVQIPVQTEFVVRMIDGVDSQTAKEGDLFRASLDQPIVINGQTAVPRGADAQVKLVQAQQSGKFTGKTELTLSLWTVTVNNKVVPIDTQNITKASSSRGEQTAKVAGGAAAAGAVIGAIAGGGKGAAIGAGSGAAGGAAVEAATKGQRVKVASETLLTFALEKPVDTSRGTAAVAAAPAAATVPAQSQVAQATPPPPPAPPPAPPKIGQTQDAVVAALGYPDSVDASGDKQIYIYKNMKVTFINGKVSKVE